MKKYIFNMDLTQQQNLLQSPKNLPQKPPQSPQLIKLKKVKWKKKQPKNRPLAGTPSYEWYDWLIGRIHKSIKNSVSDVEEKVMNLFLKDYKPKKIAAAFDGIYLV